MNQANFTNNDELKVKLTEAVDKGTVVLMKHYHPKTKAHLSLMEKLKMKAREWFGDVKEKIIPTSSSGAQVPDEAIAISKDLRRQKRKPESKNQDPYLESKVSVEFPEDQSIKKAGSDDTVLPG